MEHLKWLSLKFTFEFKYGLLKHEQATQHCSREQLFSQENTCARALI